MKFEDRNIDESSGNKAKLNELKPNKAGSLKTLIDFSVFFLPNQP